MYRLFFVLCFFLHPTATWAAEPVDLSAGEVHACALYEDGAVYCWGEVPGDEALELPFTAWRVSDLPPAVAIASGRLGSCAISAAQELWCWGLDYQRSARANSFLGGLKPFLVENLPPVTDVAIGFGHNCALSEAGEVWCWGGNFHGEVSKEENTSIGEPVKIPFLNHVIDISAGVNGSCALLSHGKAVCWGSDNPTMPGVPFIYESRTPVYFDLQQFGRLSAIESGRNFTCGISLEGQVTCWGSNIFSQLGTASPRVPIRTGGIGEVEGIEAATDIDASYFAACAVQHGKVICWGLPLYELAKPATDWEGNTPPLRKPGEDFLPPHTLSGIEQASRVAVGEFFVCVINAGKVLCLAPPAPAGKNGAPREFLPGAQIDHAVPVPGLP